MADNLAENRKTVVLNRPAVLGVGLAALAAIGFSGKAILVKLAYVDRVDAVTLLAVRMLFSVPFFMVAGLWSLRQKHLAPLTQRDFSLILTLGLIGYYLSSLLDFLGLQYISAGLERLILFLYPTVVVILSAIVFKRPFGRREIIALLLSYAGIALVVMHDVKASETGMIIGAALVFASTLTYAIYLVGAGQAIARIGAARFTAYAMLVACAATLIQFAVTHPLSALALPPRVYGLGIAMAIFSTVLPVFMLAASIRAIGPGHAALIGSIGPIATIFMAHVFLGEEVSLQQVGGGLLVLIGVLIISLAKR